MLSDRQKHRNARVTIIVPVYNSEEYLDACLASLASQLDDEGQPLDEYKVMILDDGSHDGSGDIAKKHVAEHPDAFSYAWHENMGVSKTRNKGIELCDTEYLMFMDNDDLVEPDYVWKHLQAIEDSDADIVMSGYKRTDGKSAFGEVATADGPWTKYRFLAPWAKIYRTDFLKDNGLGFFENNIGEDVVFLMEAYGKTERIRQIPYAGYLWRVNDKSVSNSIQRGLQEDCRIDRVVEELDRVTIPGEDDLMDYFRFRYGVWYLLFSGGSATPERFVEVANELLGDGEATSGTTVNSAGDAARDGDGSGSGGEARQSPKKLISPFSTRLKGEPLRNRLSILVFKGLKRFHAYGLFAKLYCKGS